MTAPGAGGSAMPSDPLNLTFRDRREAGDFLANLLLDHAGRDDAVVLGLPRGGVPVAYEVAQRLAVPLDVWVVRKLGAPDRPELAIGAVAGGGVCVLNDDIVRGLRLSHDQVQTIREQAAGDLQRRERLYRAGGSAEPVEGKTVILVDDGLATGASMRAAVTALRARQVRRIVVAVPVGEATACRELTTEVDEMICGITPEPFFTVGQWYADFRPTTDEEVAHLLGCARHMVPANRSASMRR